MIFCGYETGLDSIARLDVRWSEYCCVDRASCAEMTAERTNVRIRQEA